MSIVVSRTCTEIAPDGERTPGLSLASLRERPAYALLGEPGAGKTTAFEEEAKAAGVEPISARDFVVWPPREEWRDKTLFIDGLDEMRAGSTDGRTQFAAIRRNLDALGRPPFRISCREADWLGASDQDDLARVAPGGKISVLHLDNLTDEQIGQLLRGNHGVDEPLDFLDKARERRLDGLLGNPQTLGMLAKAVPQRWPDSLKETYALACDKLAEEPNKRHRDARRGAAVATDTVLHAAGHACAAQLLAGIAGFALDQTSADAFHPTFEAIGLDSAPALNQALGSRLFESGGHEEWREPAHRSIAEYLGARFLARSIDKAGLPLGRILALMLAGDGGIVSDLRGLHAWFAVHYGSVRQGCIDRDPLGIVLNGDLRSFDTADKRRLLLALRSEAQRYSGFRFQNWEASPFGALAGPDTSDDFRRILTSTARDEAHESLLDCVLEAVTHGEALPELGEALLAVVRDNSHWPMNRRQAIEAYFRACRDAPEPLVVLLDDINVGKVEDGDDGLLGLLLKRLYPACLPASQVIDYLHSTKSTDRIGGTYQDFWEYDLIKRTAAQDLPALLDSVAGNSARLKFSSDRFYLNRFAGELLATGLETAGDSIPALQLWTWLGIGLDEDDYCHFDKDHQERIARWLSERQETYRALLRIFLDRCSNDAKPVERFFRIEHRFHGAEMPPGAEEWWFAEAAKIKQEDFRRLIFNKGAFSLVRRLDYTPALLDALLAVAERHPALKAIAEEWLQSEWVEWRQDEARRKAERKSKEQARIEEWVGHFRKHHAAIEEGTAPPGIMRNLAMIYFGRYREAKGDTPIARLKSFFDNDAGITLATLTGLRRCLSRNELPSVREIAEIDTKGQHHVIAEACLAGAEELAREGESAILALDRDVQARLVAFRLTHDFGSTPAWLLSLVRHRPELVAEVLIDYASVMFKARKEHVHGLYPLAHDEAYATVARHAALRLLAAYPLRWKKERLGDLDVLLIAALKCCDGKALLDLIGTKLSRPSLDGAQRSRWLAAGLLLDPAKYEAPLARYAGENPSRAMLVAGFFDSRPTPVQGLPELAEPAASLLIRLLAPHLSPERPTGVHTVTPTMEAADLVRALISRLGANPDASAADTLDALLSDDSLRAWHGLLRHHRESQRLVSREAHFRRASAADIVRTLANAEPANAADLKALLVQHLRDIAREDRDGNTTGYERYWKADKPQHENYCRDRLLELLREKLRPTRVDAQPEGEYRENKRADIRASFGGTGGFNVPIEIKRDCHKDLWTALRKQLMAHYVRDPGADGHGIYLVFWFGRKGKGMPTAADGGRRPGSAQELEDRLRATLKPKERQYIEVIAMDCTPPTA
ncbi:MAG: hypothetical protein KGZ31_03035 [Sulfuritalea sp.]|nr:hypothetical protein [Sulfuritalea sp.]